ncbi:hypothetical protein ASPWEDRAFT_37768 [Aspergillus wentii DTO 134E9]|uniref:Presequence translocated-associated motor subunit PAM17 n=1 Tax=Aspergillus wentii DTO 134E9 TaxID=1073089 RepID=A0A1L9RY49_ASPWE|nr:uncharacterized protein ASPWEDRAFT_37768 [Aspergillus wentii DTO 134E9]KAI9931433.1 TIM23 complex component [Aspergillus wentii]OJJ39896.1 hypothetical protein ASPWEDRAFT_37768 [Aspergillus wentii DTO 134E9]
MHGMTISAPVRNAVLGGRLSSAALGPLASSPMTSQKTSWKQHTRPVSTSSTQINGVSAPATALKATPRPQATTASLSPVLQSTSVRANSTSSDVSGREEAKKLDWNSFFKLRASRRRYSLASSIATSLVSTTAGVQFLSTQDLEGLGAQVMGLDPFVVLGMATAACGAAGWLVGPFVGNGVWGLVNRKYKTSVMVKEKEFYDRIKRFRVDPSSNSIANPVPDYYGEKIGSVQGYRQWLKDQRAYNRKRRNFIA